MEIISLISIAIIICILSVSIKAYQPAFALILSLVGGIFLFTSVFQTIEQLISYTKQFIVMAGVSSEIYLPLIKIVGISIMIRLCCAVCKDAGQQTIATKLEVVGCIASLSLCFPLIENLVELISNIMGSTPP